MVDGVEKAHVPSSTPMITNIEGLYCCNKFMLKNVYRGIICISNDTHIVLINPSTRESRNLPFPWYSYPYANMLDSYVLGVWFDHHQSNSNQPPQGALQHYKVFRAVISFIGRTYREFQDVNINILFEIYDSREDCWRQGKTLMCKDISTWSHLLFNGIFHLSVVDGDNSMITIDAKSEMLGRLPLPSEINDPFKAPSLYILRGSLALFVDNYNDKATDIWLMNEYGVKQSWTKQYTIEFDASSMRSQCMAAITFWKYMDKEEEEDELFLQNSDGKLISINLITKKVTHFEFYGIPCPMTIVPYIETLLPLK
ncbi:F-box/kelch-repeat protein At3g06240-like [Impatiens glandulifera]|uniref:F-box/kelch-repeat protein At3g06240-like n=1 Tax=Impatiens glandulifera TaxID=253017 RepID=UPI001FB0E66D|nr:F-box/kelch-repeat protein At3g06240-like [Impatiens glandulifera]